MTLAEYREAVEQLESGTYPEHFDGCAAAYPPGESSGLLLAAIHLKKEIAGILFHREFRGEQNALAGRCSAVEAQEYRRIRKAVESLTP